MPALPTYQYRKFGPAASTFTLAAAGGATLGGIWVSAKGTSPNIAVFDALSTSKASTNSIAVASTVPAALGPLNYPGGLELGRGLVVKVASVTGTIFWRPGQAGGV